MDGADQPRINEMVERIGDAVNERLETLMALSIGYEIVDALAVAVLRALREPSDAMVDVGAEYVLDPAGSATDIARAAWIAMVDEMLEA